MLKQLLINTDEAKNYTKKLLLTAVQCNNCKSLVQLQGLAIFDEEKQLQRTGEMAHNEFIKSKGVLCAGKNTELILFYSEVFVQDKSEIVSKVVN